MGLTELFGWQGAVAAEFILTWVAIYFIFMRPRKSAPPGTDSRYDHRYRSRFKGWLKCNGKNHRIRLVDLNKSGALVTRGCASGTRFRRVCLHRIAKVDGVGRGAALRPPRDVRLSYRPRIPRLFDARDGRHLAVRQHARGIVDSSFPLA